MSIQPATKPRAFAVLFKDLRFWSVSSFSTVKWYWPAEYIKPLSSAMRRIQLGIDRKANPLETLQLVTLHFDGTMERRALDGKGQFKGKLFSARAGDVVYSKIDVRNGAIGIVPDEFVGVAVSSEYPVYRIDLEKAYPEYIQLLFRTSFFRQAINGMISGASGRKRVQPSQLEALEVPLPPLNIQESILKEWQKAQEDFQASKNALREIPDNLNQFLWDYYYDNCKNDILNDRWLALTWTNLSRWDVKTARAAAFRISNPTFKPLGEWAEESTELVKPWSEPEKEWPVYGVNNKAGVVFSHHQKGRDFNAPYKRIRKNWFFHNPTRSSVGSLGIVPDVPEDAITSPEYQVWRIKEERKAELIPAYVAVLINTPFFIKLIQFHRVGAVKQRLYVDNLLEIPIPVLPIQQQELIAAARRQALESMTATEENLGQAKSKVEALILGTQSVEGEDIAA
jgi:restriction endonuclease S subunit